MFQPASLKGDSPTPIDERIRKKFLILYIAIIILSLIPTSLFEFWYITFFWSETYFWVFFISLPFNIFLSIYLIQLSAILISVLFLKIIILIHNPKEGNLIHVGTPVSITLPIQSVEESQHKAVKVKESTISDNPNQKKTDSNL